MTDSDYPHIIFSLSFPLPIVNLGFGKKKAFLSRFPFFGAQILLASGVRSVV